MELDNGLYITPHSDKHVCHKYVNYLIVTGHFHISIYSTVTTNCSLFIFSSVCNLGGYWYIILTLSHTHMRADTRTCPPDWSCSLLLFADNTSVQCFSLSLWVLPTLPLRKCVISPSNESSTFYLHPHGLIRWRDGRIFQLMLHPGYRYACLITPTTPPSRRVFLLSSFFLSVRACIPWLAPLFRYVYLSYPACCWIYNVDGWDVNSAQDTVFM